MKKILILLVAMVGSICYGQTTPPTAKIYYSMNGIPTAFLSTSTTPAQPTSQTFLVACLNAAGQPVVATLTSPCLAGSSTGGGATLPFPGIVFGTSATGGTVATSSQIQTAIGPNVYDLFGAASNLLASTNVWTGASNTFNNGIRTNTATQGIDTTNGLVNSLNGVTSLFAGTSATSSSGNISSGVLQFLSSFWNGTNTINHTWQVVDMPSSGVNPNFILAFTPNSSAGTGTNTIQFNANVLAGTTPSAVCTVLLPCGENINTTTGILPTARIPVNIANGVNFWGNSIIAGTGPQPIVLNYRQIFTNLFPVGPVPNNRTLAGTFTADVINFGALQRSIGSVATAPYLMPSYNAPLNIIQSLENDANFTTATSANQITYTQTVDMALLALGTAPVDQWNQVTGNSWVFTGGATPTDNFYGSIAPGVLLTTSQTASTTITTVAVPGSTVSEPIDILYTVFASDTGSFNINIDSAACTDTITGASTLPNAPFGGATLETSQGYTRTLALARCVPTSVGSHTVAIVPISGGTNGIGIQAIFTSPLSLNNFTGPTSAKVGVMRQQSDTKSTTTALYNTLSINDCNQMLADGFRCINSPAREPYITLNNLAFMMSSTTATQGGAIDLTGMSWTAGNATLTAPSGVNPSYMGKTAICVNGLTSSTDLFATVQSVPSSTTLLLSIISPSAAPGTTVTGTGVCHFGYNDTVTLGSITPGLHPTTAGDDALLRGLLSVIQPTMVSPNFQTLQTFNGGLQANVQSGLVPNILNIGGQSPNPASGTLPTLNWQIFPGGTANFAAGFGLIGNTTTATAETMLFSRSGTSVDIADNNVVGSVTNNAFRIGFRFLQGTAAGAGLQMPTEIANALQYQTPANVIASSTTPTILGNGGLQTNILTANAVPTLGGVALQPGAIISLNICENATGGFTWTWPAAFLNPKPINTAASACTFETFQSSNGTTLSYIGGSGQSAASGTATLVAGTVTVSTPASCTPGATCNYQLTNCGPAGITGTLSIGTVTAGTSFVINSIVPGGTTVALDTSLACWKIN